VCCRTLESIYHDAGYPEEATRYGELAGKYEDRAAQAPVTHSQAAAPLQPAAFTPEPPVVSAVAETVVPEATATTSDVPVADASAAPETFFHEPALSVSEAGVQETQEFEVTSEPAAEEAIDLSAEWEGALSEETAPSEATHGAGKAAGSVRHVPPSQEAVAEAVEEIRFYLANGMTEEAQATLGKLEHLGADAAQVSALRAELESAKAQTPAAEAVSLEQADTLVETEVEAVSVEEPRPGALDALVNDLESSLGDGFAAQTTAHEAPVPQEAKPEIAVTATPTAAHTAPPSSPLNEFVADLETSLGDKFLAGVPVAQQAPAEATAAIAPSAPPPSAEVPAAMAAAAAQSAPAQQAAASPTFTYQPTPIRPLASQAPSPTSTKFDAGAGVDLAGMFGELKQELEEGSNATEEDPETHYNLGVAFREMGLLDEAIGELQKVCQAVEHGHPFPHVMQTYTWLSQCFLDKGVPEAAIRWYEKALDLPNLDQDTRTALHYELASSYETAGNRTSALNHFMEVYGSNIDYRDVAERIKTLKS
jgi:tetratricopeptide (TPR) repeat protein